MLPTKKSWCIRQQPLVISCYDQYAQKFVARRIRFRSSRSTHLGNVAAVVAYQFDILKRGLQLI